MKSTPIVRMFTTAAMASLVSVAVSAPAYSADLNITITSIEESQGQLMLAIYDSKSTFGKTFLNGQSKMAVAGDMTFTFPDLPTGEYAVMVYHDQNNNGELDTNLLGIPTEPWGASLQGKRVFGAPSWKDTKFEVSDENFSLTVALN